MLRRMFALSARAQIATKIKEPFDVEGIRGKEAGPG